MRLSLSPPLSLSLSAIFKSFPPVQALAGANLNVRRGTVHALLGENGAGKTTLVRIAFGLEQADAGDVRVDDRLVRLRGPEDAIALGVGMVHQHFTAIPRLTVAENVALGGRGRFDARRVSDRIHAVGEETGLVLAPDELAGDLAIAAQARLEVVKALVRGARTLILDEPTASLAPREAADLLVALRRLADDGMSVVLITHKLREAVAVADEITVLRAGRTVFRAAAGEVTESILAGAMLGARHDDERNREDGGSRQTVAGENRRALVSAHLLTVHDEQRRPRLRDVSFVLYAGEIVGVAGVEGSGHREMLRAIAGRLPVVSGTLGVASETAFIPEDRQGEALLLDRPLYENIALRDAVRLPSLVPWREVAAHTSRLLAAYDIHATGPGARARTLSGGNQQKLVLARELDGAPVVIVAENPCRGLDVSATAAVHGRLVAARDAGALVVLYSTDVDELLGLADRVLVAHAGELHEVQLDRRAIGDAMLGLAAPA